MKGTKIYIFNLFVAFLYLGCSSLDSPDNDGGSGNPVDAVLEFDRDYVFLESNSKIKDRNFYWTTLVENSVSINNLIKNDTELSSFLATAKQRLKTIAVQNNVTAAQYAEALKFTDDERNIISVAIKNLASNNTSSFINFSNMHIGPSGAFIIFKSITNVGRLNQLMVEEILLGINQIIDTYGVGIDPLYPTIDSVSFDVNSEQYKILLKNLISSLNANEEQYELFYQPFLNFALGLLELNDREEAARYIPLTNGENSLAYQYLQSINWSDYDYSLIVVLGDSPNSSGDLPNISLGGMARADHGVELFNQGLAPIIVFSGGHLWPVHTEFSEAIEMKKYVMEKYNIPENKILVDPHSRHTTTNMRNIGRLIFRYGVPSDKKAIVSTSKTHSEYVTSSGYLTRCQNEMSHIPLKLYERLSDFDLEFTPLIEVLHLDSSDPLDP